MKLLAFIVMLWLLMSLLGAVFGIFGKLVWIAIIGTIIAALWNFIHKDGNGS